MIRSRLFAAVSLSLACLSAGAHASDAAFEVWRIDPNEIRAIKAVSTEDSGKGTVPPGEDDWPEPVTLLVDARDPERRGGTGRLGDWAAARRLAGARRVLLAGGLTPDNVADAVTAVRPFGVEVVLLEPGGGLRQALGQADARRIAEQRLRLAQVLRREGQGRAGRSSVRRTT